MQQLDPEISTHIRAIAAFMLKNELKAIGINLCQIERKEYERVLTLTEKSIVEKLFTETVYPNDQRP